MRRVNPGEPLQITQTEIRQIEAAGRQTNSRRVEDTDNPGDDYVIVQNNTNEKIAAGSVLGIEDFDPEKIKVGVYDTFYLTFATRDVNNIRSPKLDSCRLAWYPSYRNHQGLFGVLDQPLYPSKVGRLKISGYAVAWVNVLQELQVSGSVAGRYEIINLRPAEKREDMRGGGGLVIPFVVGQDSETAAIGTTRRIYGSAHIIHPSDQRLTVANNNSDPVYRLLPQGFQLMRVWLGTSNPDMWEELILGYLE